MLMQYGDGNYLDHRHSCFLMCFTNNSEKPIIMIRICRLSATSHYLSFSKMSDLRIYDDFPRYHSTGHNIPQGRNFRVAETLETPV